MDLVGNDVDILHEEIKYLGPVWYSFMSCCELFFFFANTYFQNSFMVELFFLSSHKDMMKKVVYCISLISLSQLCMK